MLALLMTAFLLRNRLAAVTNHNRSLVLGRHEGDSVATTNDHHLALAIGIGKLPDLLELAATSAAMHTARWAIELELLDH